jgi:hypothetical protein
MPPATHHSRARFWVQDVLIDQYGARIGANAIAVYCILARHADRAGQAYPSKRTIADKTGLAKRTVDAAITKLMVHGLIQSRSRKMASGKVTSNMYVLVNIPSVLNSLDVLIPLGAGAAPPPVQELPGDDAGDAPLSSWDLWATILADLKLQMTRDVFLTYLAATTATRANGTVTVHCPNRYAAEWVAKRFARKIIQTIKARTQEDLAISATCPEQAAPFRLQ